MDSSIQIVIIVSPLTSSLCTITMKPMHIKKFPFGVNKYFQIIKIFHLSKLHKNHIFESLSIKIQKTLNLGHIITHKGVEKIVMLLECWSILTYTYPSKLPRVT
jgi:hypothetical protein